MERRKLEFSEVQMKHKIVISNEDIMYKLNDHAFNTRVVGLLIRDKKLLMAQMQGDDFWTLPGGKIRHFESSNDAVVREFEEEIGGKFETKRLLTIIENFFEMDEEKWHQFIFVYELNDIEKVPFFQGERKIKDADGVYRWFDIDDLQDEKIKPNVLRNLLNNIPKQLEHSVNFDQ